MSKTHWFAFFPIQKQIQITLPVLVVALKRWIKIEKIVYEIGNLHNILELVWFGYMYSVLNNTDLNTGTNFIAYK